MYVVFLCVCVYVFMPSCMELYYESLLLAYRQVSYILTLCEHSKICLLYAYYSELSADTQKIYVPIFNCNQIDFQISVTTTTYNMQFMFYFLLVKVHQCINVVKYLFYVSLVACLLMLLVSH